MAAARSDDTYRRRLEERAELLEATRLRYRALVQMLRGLLWKDRLRRNADLVREVARVLASVDEAHDAAEKRALAEGWPLDAPMFVCVREVAELRDELERALARRLRSDEALPELLERLENDVLMGPRAVLPGQRWATAVEVLPASLPELRAADEFGEFLEAVFKRPADPDGRLPFDAGEAVELSREWPAGEAVLARLWQRLAAVDKTGSLVRYLQRRSRRAPIRPPRSGPERLLRAEFWHGVALARLREIAVERLSPVEPRDAELLEVVRWLAAREKEPKERLAASEQLSDARAGLFELAHELWVGLKRASAGNGAPRWPAGFWERLAERARRADLSGAREDDAERLRDNLRLFIRIRARSDEAAVRDVPLYRVLGAAPPSRRAAPRGGESFAELVSEAKALAMVQLPRRPSR